MQPTTRLSCVLEIPEVEGIVDTCGMDQLFVTFFILFMSSFIFFHFSSVFFFSLLLLVFCRLFVRAGVTDWFGCLAVTIFLTTCIQHLHGIPWLMWCKCHVLLCCVVLLMTERRRRTPRTHATDARHGRTPRTHTRTRAEGEELPFDEIISCNIGNPQALGQKPLSFNREVLSLITNPSLLEHPSVTTMQVK